MSGALWRILVFIVANQVMPKMEFLEEKCEMASSESREELFLKCSRCTKETHEWKTRFLAALNYPQTSMEHWISMSAVVCFRWLALFLSLKASYRLHQLRSWGEPEGESQQRYLRNKDFLLGVNFPLSFPNLCSCPLLKVSTYFTISYLW